MKKLAIVILVLFAILAPAQWYNYPQPMRFDGESVIFQPTLDQTDFLQILDADGGTPVLNVDTTNERVGIRTSSPDTMFHVKSPSATGGHIKVDNTGTGDTSYYLAKDGTNKWRFRNDHTGTMGTDGLILTDDDSIERLGISQTGDFYFNGNVGFGTANPDTLTHWEGTAPYLTLHNSTHEDTDGGRESRIYFKGEQSGGEETTLAAIMASHDGSADDQKGQIGIYTNDGSDDNLPTLAVTVDSAQNIFLHVIKSGATQAAAGAAANELWKTSGHATLPDNVVMIGI